MGSAARVARLSPAADTALIAESVKEVVDVYKLDFGVPEAFWKIRVEDFPCVVTMDSHGESLHEKVQAQSQQNLQKLLAG